MNSTGDAAVKDRLGSSDVLGVVLAGGRSSRMGRDKASLPHPAGGTLLQYAVAVLQEVCPHVVISGHQQLAGAASLPDPVVDRGPAMGVARAVTEAAEMRCSAALIVPVDMPAVEAPHLRRLLDAWRSQPEQIVAATFGEGFAEPLLAVYPVAYVDALHQLAASQHRGLSGWLTRNPHRQVALPPNIAINLNTPDQWKRFRAEP